MSGQHTGQVGIHRQRALVDSPNHVSGQDEKHILDAQLNAPLPSKNKGKVSTGTSSVTGSLTTTTGAGQAMGDPVLPADQGGGGDGGADDLMSMTGSEFFAATSDVKATSLIGEILMMLKHHLMEMKKDDRAIAKADRIAEVAERVAGYIVACDLLDAKKADAEETYKEQFNGAIAQLIFAAASTACSIASAGVKTDSTKTTLNSFATSASTASQTTASFVQSRVSAIQANSKTFEYEKEKARIELEQKRKDEKAKESKEYEERTNEACKSCMDIVKQMMQIDSQTKQVAANFGKA